MIVTNDYRKPESRVFKNIFIGALSMLFCLNTYAGELIWKNGIPPRLEKDNPYLRGMNSAVAKSKKQLKEDKSPGHFFLVWGAIGDGSKYRDDESLRKIAFEQFDLATIEREKKPSAFWSIYSDLEALNLWRIDGKVSKEQLNIWKERLRPSLKANIELVTDETKWMNWAANTLNQSAAILELGATVFGQLDHNDEDVNQWRSIAKKNIEKACEIQLPGGAFSYIRTSGPDPVYFNFDAAHLGRYYQLTGSEKVKKALINIARWSNAATISGELTTFSSPWWKHIAGKGGPYTGLEMANSIADNPLAADVMEQRRSFQQAYIWLYSTMYSYTKRPVKKVNRDRCEIDLNSNGPALRIGGLDMEIPGCAWSDSTFGISVSNKKGFSSLVNAIYIAPNQKGESREDSGRSGQDGYIMVGPKDLNKFAGITGDNEIAGGRSLYPHKGMYGQVPPDKSNWKRTDLWYANENGATGFITMECLQDSKLVDMEIWVCTNKLNAEMEAGKLTFPDFKIEFSGAELLEPYKMIYKNKNTKFYCFPFKNGGKREFKKGEKFTAQVSISLPEKKILSVEKSEIKADGSVSMGVNESGKSIKTILYNPAKAEISME